MTVGELIWADAQARYGELGGSPPALDFAAEARLVSFLRQAAPLCSLVHDVSTGGIAVCLAEAAVHSGCGAEVALGGDLVELFGEVGGRAVLACSSEAYPHVRSLALELDQPLLRIGSAGGATLLGVELEELREAWESKLPAASRRER